MAISRNARRKLAKQRHAAKLKRFEGMAQAQRQGEIADIVRSNMSNPHKPERTPKGLVSGIWGNYGQSVSPRKHCEAKQKVTVYGKDMSLAGQTIGRGKFG